MKQLPFLALAVALGGCASAGDRIYAPVKNIEYGAISHDPFWLISIGDGQAVLTRGSPGGRADGELHSFAYKNPVPSYTGGVKRWQAGAGNDVMTLEARPGPCTTGGRRYADHVKLFLGARTMTGCGGREVPAERRG
jgi:uncharacterized membrane protein